jgi:8-oxo-dGTP pyrophosphatase MutT (NUDIX family)
MARKISKDKGSKTPNKVVHKIGAIILKERQILVVKKNFSGRVEYIIPGGKQEVGETDRQTLIRELEEELGIKLLKHDFFGHFEEMAIFENIPLVMDVYLAKIDGSPAPRSEIKGYLWVDRNYSQNGVKLGTVLSRHVIPRLIEMDLM